MRAERIFGDIDGVPEGRSFATRDELAAAGIHRPTQAGVSGGMHEGADSIVVSGGYEDDEDFGDVIIYTGHGGNDPETGKQIADQKLERGNLALVKSQLEALPVRVVRGANGDFRHSPRSGYRYDGLYFVESHWQEVGRSGFVIFRYRLVKDRPSDISSPGSDQPAPRRLITTQRVVRNTDLASRVKELHEDRCQVCGTRIETPAGSYSEGAHIQPLGSPHYGPDVVENVLCLCPNDHVRFDNGSFSITDDLRFIGNVLSDYQRLRVISKHRVETRFLQHHRKRFGFEQERL